MSEIAKVIAEQNDMFRQSFADPLSMNWRIKGRYVATEGIGNLPYNQRVEIIYRVRSFDDFTEDNDPYGEHDFGRIQLEENKHDILWKIDYFDPTYQYHSEDKSNLKLTRRVLTVMLAHEY